MQLLLQATNWSDSPIWSWQHLSIVTTHLYTSLSLTQTSAVDR